MWPHLLVDVLFPSFFSKIELLLNSVFKSVSSILNWQVLSFNEDQNFFFLLLIICTLRVFNLKTYTYKYVSALHFVLSLLPWVHWLINVFTIYHHTYYLLRLIILWDQKYSNRQDSTCPQNRVISTSQHSQSLFEKLETCIFTKYSRN